MQWLSRRCKLQIYLKSNFANVFWIFCICQVFFTFTWIIYRMLFVSGTWFVTRFAIFVLVAFPSSILYSSMICVFPLCSGWLRTYWWCLLCLFWMNDIHFRSPSRSFLVWINILSVFHSKGVFVFKFFSLKTSEV